ncbi:MAG TPA: hypothetical protein VKS98_04930 [Chthoniobacterales bacterium]|nr:hypothetical protein [Chthoniobacterales bacterium]
MTLDQNITFKCRDLEITRDALVLHFYNDKTVIPLNEIKSYRLDWHLHDPIFGKKFWFLVLTVELENDREESAPVTSVRFNYLDDDLESRRHIARALAEALDQGLARAAGVAQKMICI